VYLPGRARARCDTLVGRTQGIEAFASGRPVSCCPTVAHGALEAPPRARNYFLALGAVLVTVYNLTDLDADPNG
jgi:hypothetical protein